MEYTKGPWGKMGSNGIMSLSGTLVATASSDGVLDKETVIQNAKLIAAAPELLEKLKELREFINDIMPGCAAGQDQLEYLQATSDRLIQKATL